MITVKCFLIVGQNFRAPRYGGTPWIPTGQPTVRTTKGKPSTGKNELAIELELNLPDECFRRPEFTATINVSENQSPSIITAHVRANIAEEIKKQTGITVHVKAAEVTPVLEVASEKGGSKK